MIADHAARVFASRAGFRAEARSVADEFHGKLLGRNYLLAHEIRHRHFGRGNEIERLLPANHKQILLELR